MTGFSFDAYHERVGLCGNHIGIWKKQQIFFYFSLFSKIVVRPHLKEPPYLFWTVPERVMHLGHIFKRVQRHDTVVVIGREQQHRRVLASFRYFQVM